MDAAHRLSTMRRLAMGYPKATARAHLDAAARPGVGSVSGLVLAEREVRARERVCGVTTPAGDAARTITRTLASHARRARRVGAYNMRDRPRGADRLIWLRDRISWYQASIELDQDRAAGYAMRALGGRVLQGGRGWAFRGWSRFPTGRKAQVEAVAAQVDDTRRDRDKPMSV